jgi:hypothetical protein
MKRLLRNAFFVFLSNIVVFGASAQSAVPTPNVLFSPFFANRSACKVDYSDQYVYLLSDAAQQVLQHLYRMSFLAGTVCSHYTEAGLTVTREDALALEYDAHKASIGQIATQSYVDYLPYPEELPTYRVTLSEVNQRFIAQNLQLRKLGIESTTLRGNTIAAQKLAACSSLFKVQNALVMLSVCK